MRLAYICSDRSIAVFGPNGRGAYIQEVLRALSRRGAQVDLFAARLDGDRPEGLENVRLHKLSMFGKELLSDDTSMLRANRELRRMLNSTRGRAFDVILERFSPWCYAGVEQARASGIPCLLETTEYGIEEQMKLPEDVRRISQETLEGATRLVAGSADVVDRLVRAGVESQVLPGGIDPDAYSVGARLTLPHTGAFTIGYLGDLEDAEAMITLVKAFGLIHERHPAARLVVEGDGPAKSQMIASLSRSGLLGTTCFLGRLPARKIPAVLAAIDIVVIPGPQPAGARIREAMLAATPIVCGIREASPIRDRITGVTSAPGDPASLASAIELLHEDRILRMRVGSTARRGVVSDQTWDDIAAALLDMAQPRDRRAIPLSEFIPAAESASHAL